MKKPVSLKENSIEPARPSKNNHYTAKAGIALSAVPALRYCFELRILRGSSLCFRNNCQREKPTNGFLNFRLFLSLQQWLTRMVSSPISSISSQQITISSHRPNNPSSFSRPKIIIATSLAVQVSTSTSSTKPRRIPSFELITSLWRISTIRQFITTTLSVSQMNKTIASYQYILNFVIVSLVKLWYNYSNSYLEVVNEPVRNRIRRHARFDRAVLQ